MVRHREERKYKCEEYNKSFAHGGIWLDTKKCVLFTATRRGRRCSNCYRLLFVVTVVIEAGHAVLRTAQGSGGRPGSAIPTLFCSSLWSWTELFPTYCGSHSSHLAIFCSINWGWLLSELCPARFAWKDWIRNFGHLPKIGLLYHQPPLWTTVKGVSWEKKTPCI